MKKKKFPYQEISFRASGWMLVFYFGVVKYIQENYKIKSLHLTGSSGGAIAACGLICDLEMDKIIDELEEGNRHVYLFGVCDFVKSKIDNFSCYISKKKLKRNTLNIACTVFEGRNYRTHLFNQFDRVEDIANYLKGSVHVPLFGGIIPYRYNNYAMYDSIITDSHPHITNDCLKVSWTKKCECGCEKTLNVIRPYKSMPLSWCMAPPAGILHSIYMHGYYQAKLFFEHVHEEDNLKYINHIEEKLNEHENNLRKITLLGLVTVLSFTYMKIKNK